MSNNKPKIIYLKDYRPPDFTIDTIFLHFDLHEAFTEVKSILKLKRNPLAKTPNAPLKLNGENLHLKSIFLNGKALAETEYVIDDNSLTIAKAPDEFTLETVVEIKPQENTALSGLYKSRENFCTQCEAEGFRRITYYLDRPDVMARFTTTITADKIKYPILLSNGNLIETRGLSDNRHWVMWEDPAPKPSYLFALVAGDFDLLQDEFTTMSDRKVALHLYVEKGFADQGAYSLQSLKKAMQWDEEQFGREYELDIYMMVAVSDFNMGAMENKGLNIFNTRYILAKPETATDMDYVAIENVIGHEYFHNWTGNRITCRDWFQLTLKEGLTVFRDNNFTEDMTSEGVARLDNVSVVRNLQFPEDAGPTAHPIRPFSYMEINNFYTHTVYRKGSEVIRMIRTLIGKENFRKGMDIYFKRHDGQAVTTEDFVQALADGSNRDLTQFKRWYDQAGTPVLDISSAYDEKAQTYTLTVKQSCPPTPDQKDKAPFHLPLAVGLISSACKDMPTHLVGEKNSITGTRILEITKPEQTFEFVAVTEKPVISLLRNFSAPVIVNYDYTDDELLWLLQCDSDPYSRYEAGQQYMKRLIARLIEDHKAGKSLKIDHHLVSVFKTILEKPHTDLQYLARLLQLPTFSFLLQQLKDTDIDLIYIARDFIKKSLARELKTIWQKYYAELQTPRYQTTQQDMGKRAMKNVALDYLTALEDPEFFQAAYRQFQQADNMTDRMGALMALNDHATPLRENALNEFYQQWKSQPLVVNKWLTLQAISLLPETLMVVKRCMQNKAFDINNPNNVYALIVAFANNLLRFNAKSGEGYQFVADQVIKIDPMNPQIAARVLQPLLRWRQMDVGRQKLMRKELERIQQVEKLSNDVYELVNKSLSI